MCGRGKMAPKNISDAAKNQDVGENPKRQTEDDAHAQ